MRARLLPLALIAGCGSPPEELPPPPEVAVAIASPAPGAELVASEHPRIVVSGTVEVSDPAAAVEAYVNGERIELVDGAFTVELMPALGINHIAVEAGTASGALVGEELDVLWSPAYVPPRAGETGFEVAGAVELRLGQRFFDARLVGTMLDTSTDPVIAHDVASALELILWHVDLAGLIDGGIHIGGGGASLDVALEQATPASIVVDARIVDGAQPALDLKIDLLGVFLALDGTFAFGSRVLAVDGGITADLHASARLTLGTAPDGSIEVGVVGVTATVGPLVPAFEGPDGAELDAFIAITGSSFRTLIEDLLGDELIPTFTDRLPPFLEQVLGAADQLLDDLRFTLDTELGDAIDVELDGRIGALEVRTGATAGHVTVRQDLTLRTSRPPFHAASLGAARFEPLGMPVIDTSSVHLVIRQDLLNALLHALWNSGLIEGQLTTGGLAAKVSARLPPVVRPMPAESACRIDDQRCDVLLQLGQVEVELPDLAQRFGINATAGVRVVVDGTTVSLVIQEVPELRVWEIGAGGGPLTPVAVRDLIERRVWPGLFGAIGDNLTIELPLPDLAELGLGELAPGLADAELTLALRQRPGVAGGRIVLGAGLELATPPPP